MKCQQCDKSAVFHITELEEGEVREVHLCEDHARGYLTQTDGDGDEGPEKPTVGGMLAGPLSIAKTADDLAEIDQKACSMCGITFFEFRNNGRLGCPHDYVQFEKELEPLIANIHGATEHVGRSPARFPDGTEPLTAAIGMRREMKDAIECEDYEQAGSLRDELRKIDEQARHCQEGTPPSATAAEAQTPPGGPREEMNPPRKADEGATEEPGDETGP